MTAMEFLNILSYRNDRNAQRKREIEQWKRTH